MPIGRACQQPTFTVSDIRRSQRPTRNTSIKSRDAQDPVPILVTGPVAAGDHGHSEDDLRYVRRRYFTVPACRDAARAIANATFAARQVWLWGEGTTAVASDSTHVTAFDQNIFTEWHSRYRRGKRGVLIYWTVERGGAMAVHSQLLSCSASEVHAMVEGAMRHGTDMTIESNYVDSHGPGSSGSASPACSAST